MEWSYVPHRPPPLRADLQRTTSLASRVSDGKRRIVDRMQPNPIRVAGWILSPFLPHRIVVSRLELAVWFVVVGRLPVGIIGAPSRQSKFYLFTKLMMSI
jgi:hypothetical protein